jgi:hypothetical protein
VNILNKEINNFEFLASVLFEEFLFLAVISWIHRYINLLQTNEYCPLLYGTLLHCEAEYKNIGAIWTSEREGDSTLQVRQRCVSHFLLFSWIIKKTHLEHGTGRPYRAYRKVNNSNNFRNGNIQGKVQFARRQDT